MTQWEKDYEDHICALLAKHGVAQIAAKKLDRINGVCFEEFIAFVEQSQPEELKELQKYYSSKAKAIDAIERELLLSLNQRGMLATLREGFTVRNILFRAAYFRPSDARNKNTLIRYQYTRVQVARQVAFRPNSIATYDLMIFVNGIPTAAIELKALDSSNKEIDAIKQTRETRIPDCIILSHRLLAAFSVNENDVLMTPRLDGEETSFTPFNRGDDGHAGNPPAPDGEFPTDYLWNWIFSKDTWLWIIQMLVKEIPPSATPDGRPAVTFPWYHQIECIDRLVNGIQSHGRGGSYLIQHSTGSGKSNTIAGTIHALSLTNDATGAPLFDKILLVSPRLNIDKQLGEALASRARSTGVIQTCKNTAQLRQALKSSGTRIIVSTAQKFGYLDLKASSGEVLVVIDEAHVGQDKKQTSALHSAISDLDQYQSEASKRQNARLVPSNVTRIAFTATPTDATLLSFGTINEMGQRAPFHVYSIRQAVEEGRVLDPRENYYSYQTLYNLKATTMDDIVVDAKTAKAQIRELVYDHPANLSEKARIFLELYLEHVRGRIGGRGKLMIMVPRKKSVVKITELLRELVAQKGLHDTKVIGAFSGTVHIKNAIRDEDYTESSLNNGFIKHDLAKEFSRNDDIRIIVVAQKYQLGYDEPLLAGLFLDSKVSGTNAVQAISRVNRTYPGKENPIVVDFANEPDKLRRDLDRYYGESSISTPELIDIKEWWRRIMGYRFINKGEAEKAVKLHWAPDPSTRPEKTRLINLALARWNKLSEEDKVESKTLMTSYVNGYPRLASIIPIANDELEYGCAFCALLLKRIPTSRRDGFIPNPNKMIALTKLRIEAGYHGSLTYAGGNTKAASVLPQGIGNSQQRVQVQLSDVLENINNDMPLTEADSIYGGVEVPERIINDPDIRAKASNPENSRDTIVNIVVKGAIEREVGRDGGDHKNFTRRLSNSEANLQKYAEWVTDHLYERIEYDEGAQTPIDTLVRTVLNPPPLV